MRRPVFILAVVSCLLPMLPASVAARDAVHVGSIRGTLTAPTALSVQDDEIAVLEPMAKRILVFSPGGVLTRELEIGEDATGLARLDGGRYLFCEPLRHRVATVDVADGAVTGWIAGLVEPVAVVERQGLWAILDATSRQIVVAGSTGEVGTRISLPQFSDGSADALISMAWDAASNCYHVFDQLHARAMVVDTEGRWMREYCSFGAEDGSVSRIGGVACDSDGFAYVSDRYQGRVAIFDPDGYFVTNLGSGASGAVPLVVPTGVAVDAGGFVYVASTQTSSIEIFHFDKQSTLEQSLAVEPVYPLAGDLAPFQHLQLRMQLEAALTAGAPLRVDVEVHDLDAPATPVAEIRDLVVSGLSIDASDVRMGEIEWVVPVDLLPDSGYSWRVRVHTDLVAGAWAKPVEFRTLPERIPFSLEQNRPNPFNPRTVIGFSVARRADARLEIFDVRGQRVWEKEYPSLQAGRHEEIWLGVDQRGHPVSSGIYFYRFVAGDFEQTRKLAVVR